MISPRSVTAFAVSILMLASAVSCGSTEESVISDAGTDTEPVTEAVEEEPGYPYETPDMNGYSLRVLNTDDLWSFFTAVDTDQMTGEILNDAAFNRNRTVESLLNCQINVTQVASNGGLDNVNNKVKKLILAADDAYDVMYSCIDKMMSMVAEGYYYDLLTIPGLHVKVSRREHGIRSFHSYRIRQNVSARL